MTSLFARLGQFESRLTATPSQWRTTKRKRVDWVCQDCRARRSAPQLRTYSDDALRPTAEGSWLRPFGLKEAGPSEHIARARPRQKEKLRPWGLNESDSVEKAATLDRLGTGEKSVSHQLRNDVEEDGPAFWERMSQLEDAEISKTLEALHDQISYLKVPHNKAHLLEIDYATEFVPALNAHSHDMILRCILAAWQARDLDFIRGLAGPTLLAVFKLLRPSNLFGDLAAIHRELNPGKVRVMGLVPMTQVVAEASMATREVIRITRASGLKLGLEEYKVLLQSARELGDHGFATSLWQDLRRDGIAPDTECYNHFMASIVWNRTHDAYVRHSTRNTAFTMLARRQPRLHRSVQDYRTGLNGIRERTMRLFGKMLNDGVGRNEESFRMIIMAAAKEGNLDTVKVLLRKTWDIDVDALMAPNWDPTNYSAPPEQDETMRPTPDLLFTIAHAYGINNNIPAALRIVDHVAHRFDIKIEPTVWSQLFEWTFVLAIRRTGRQSRLWRTTAGRLPQRSVCDLWDTMTSAPYHVQPTMAMYNQLIKMLQMQDASPAMARHIYAAMELAAASRKAADARHTELHEALKEQMESSAIATSGRVQDYHIQSLRREFELADLVGERDDLYIRRWVRLILRSMASWVRADREASWAMRELPRLLWEWRDLVENHVEYETTGGQLSFQFRDEDDRSSSVPASIRKRQKIGLALEKAPMLLGDDWILGRSKPAD